jgi:putative protein kinase ArgK-like GTPase of G3E family|tara:strand:- start:52 stop:675 length:624 start_codon:yes stop_codon:yes gene_type:complete
MKVMTLKKNGHVVIEEVPTNSASSGAIAGLPPDEPPVRKKRKNKMGIDIFQRIRNSRLKEETMEDQTVIKEYSSENSGSNEVSSAMRMIQQKRKLQKKQEREKRAANRKQEIQALSKAKAKDYAKKAGERQKKVAKDVSKVEKTNKKESFDWQGTFNQLNEQFATLSQEQQEKFLKTWLQMSEENQNKFTSLISENFEKANQFVETL